MDVLQVEHKKTTEKWLHFLSMSFYKKQKIKGEKAYSLLKKSWDKNALIFKESP